MIKDGLHSRVITSAVGGILLHVGIVDDFSKMINHETYSSSTVCVLSKLGRAETTCVTSSLQDMQRGSC